MIQIASTNKHTYFIEMSTTIKWTVQQHAVIKAHAYFSRYSTIRSYDILCIYRIVVTLSQDFVLLVL